jgi:putative IMPACT (imprinted ancient) family translation regulator
MAHRTLARRAEHEDVVKGSRFVALVAPLEGLEDAERVLAASRARHPHATHHAFAMRWGSMMRASDDGEPGGTAGRPMLEVLLKHELDHVAAVVARTFGGTKLGAGGLARA